MKKNQETKLWTLYQCIQASKENEPKKEKVKKDNLDEEDSNETSLLMSMIGKRGLWYLDMSSSSHMIGKRGLFYEFDESIKRYFDAHG